MKYFKPSIKNFFIIQIILSIPSIFYISYLLLSKVIIAPAEFFYYIRVTTNILAIICLVIYSLNIILFVKNKFHECGIFIINTVFCLFYFFTLNNYKCSLNIVCFILKSLA